VQVQDDVIKRDRLPIVWKTLSIPLTAPANQRSLAFELFLRLSFTMVLSKYMGALALLTSAVLGKEMPVNEAKAAELYDTGIVHERIMAKKMVCYYPSMLWLALTAPIGHMGKGKGGRCDGIISVP
jgi:hypothetical protein